MADSQNQGEKARKPRPFGSFLLFLTVIVVVLVAFSGSQLRNEKEFSQDVFLHSLVTGGIQRLEFKGSNQIEGVLENGQRFRTSAASLEANEDRWRKMKAKAQYTPVQAPNVEAAMDAGNFIPNEAWIVTETTQEPTGLAQAGGGSGDSDESATSNPNGGSKGASTTRGAARHTDKLFVFGTVKSGTKLSKALDGDPNEDQVVALQVTNVSPRLASLRGKLVEAGVIPETFPFDLRKGAGTTHGPADGSLTMMLLAWGPWILILAVFLLFMRQMRSQGSGQGVMSFGRSRAQLYTKENHTGVTFEDVAGAQEAKAEVREVVEFLKNPGKFTRIGGRIPRGVLLVGSPGCGKTLLAKAIAGEAEVPFFSISGSDFVEMFVGVGASRVRDLFKQARENSPCIIFLDEIDAVGRRRGSGMGGGHDEREQTLNAILVEMDGFSTDEGIIVVAATNRPDVLDPALLRPGRFDREVTIDLPDMEGREAILNVHLKKVKVNQDIDAIDLARATPGYSGADLAAIVNEAAIMAVLDKKDEIEMSHLEEAAAKVRYGRQKISRNVEAEDLEITAYHEAGHTIVAAKLEGQIDVPPQGHDRPAGPRPRGHHDAPPEGELPHPEEAARGPARDALWRACGRGNLLWRHLRRRVGRYPSGHGVDPRHGDRARHERGHRPHQLRRTSGIGLPRHRAGQQQVALRGDRPRDRRRDQTLPPRGVRTRQAHRRGRQGRGRATDEGPDALRNAGQGRDPKANRRHGPRGPAREDGRGAARRAPHNQGLASASS